MRLDVSLRSTAHPTPLGLVVEATPATPVHALTDALAEAVGERPGVLYAGPRPLDPETSLAEAGVEDGAALGLDAPTAPTRPTPAAAVELRVVGGPGAGTTYRLAPGRYRVGGPGARVPLGPFTERARLDLVVRTDRRVLVEGADGKDTPWPDGAQRSVGAYLLEVAGTVPATAPLTRNTDDLTWDFNRPPRFVPDPAGGRFRLPTPPRRSETSPIPLATLLLTPVGAALTGILITGRWSFIFLALLSPLAALLTASGSRRRGRKSYGRQLQEYRATLARVQADVDAAVLQEQRLRRHVHPDPAALARIATQPTDRLWERRRTDADFLDLRAGTASVPSSVQVDDPSQDEHRRTTVPALEDVPVTVSVRRSGVVGVAGTDAGRQAAWLVAQAAVLHGPRDLRITVLTERAGEERWSWVRWLPHARATDTAYVSVGTTAESVSRRVGELGRLVAARAAADAERRPDPDRADVLVVLDGARRLRALPGVVALLREGPPVGVHVLCIDAEERLLPEECRAVVTAEGPAATVREPGAAETLTVRADRPERAWFEPVARGMTPLRSTGEGEDAVLPSSVRLLDVLALEPPTADAVGAGWELVPRSTTAVLGTGLDGPFSVDLVRDGPHALVAGTTGAGKSELLQTLVATLAVANRPDEMTFVLVDYKGGSAFAEAAELPHTVGMVTDLDTHLVERALVSLGAELRRRETLLASRGASDIVAYQEKRSRDPLLDPLPRLVLVIDEFASMVRELPDFVSGLVNIAQRGRSLGIHLVLATQRPSGAVTPDIRANTNLRIALRTTDQAESRDIIDAPDAGELSPRTPGRAYARLGFAALLPFQAGRIGGRRPDAATREAGTTVVEVPWTELGGSPRPAVTAPRSSQTAAPVTDLAELVRAVRQAAADRGIARVASPWLPALGESVLLDELPEPAPGTGPTLPAVPFGLVDLPAEQRQAPLTFDIDRAGHLYVIGAGRSGRSQALRTLAASLARTHRTADLHVYGIDFGSGALLPLTALPHCGAVVDRTQTERLDRMLDRLGTELTRRQALLGEHGAADLPELRATLPEAERPPHIVVLLDRFEVFERELATFDNGRYVDRFVRLLRDGVAAGMHLVVSGDKALGGGRYAGATEDKLVLRLNDRSEYSLVGVDRKAIPDEHAPGRVIRTTDGAEAQIALLDADPTGAAQAAALTTLAREVSARDADVPAARRPLTFGVLPDELRYADARTAAGEQAPSWALVGVGGDDLATLGPDLADTPTFLVGGPPRSGRSTTLLTMSRSLVERGAGLVVVAPRRSPLRDLAGTPGVVAVLDDPGISRAAFREVLTQVTQELGVIVVDDAELVLQSDLDQDLQSFARGAAGPGWAVLAAGAADSLSVTLTGWVQQARRNRAGLLLSPQALSDGELVGVRITRGMIGGRPQAGRGYLHLGDGSLTTVQVARP